MPVEPLRTQAVAQKTLSGTVWTYLSYGASKAVNLVTTAILARLLTQAEFGIVGFALTVMSFLDAVRDLGLGLALIQHRERIDEAADTAFWMGLTSNIVMWLVAVLLSPLVAAFFREPQVTVVLPVLSFSFVISGLGSTHDALISRDMKFAQRIIPSLGESFTKSIFSIAIALFGGGVWGLVVGQIVGRTSFTLLAWRVMPWRPRFRFYPDLGRKLLGFGYKIGIDSLLSALQANIDYVFVGRFLGETALGLYTVAFRVPEMVIINLCIVIAQVLFPAYSMLQDDLEQLRNGILVALRYISLVTVPAGVGLALISPLFTRTVFGVRWADAGPVMAILSLYGAVLAISWNIGDVYKAIGRPDILWKTAVIEFAMLAPVLFVLAQISTFAVSLGHLCVAITVSTIRLTIAMRVLKLPIRRTLAQFAPAVIVGLVMGVVVWFSLILTETWPDLLALFLAILAGTVVYAVFLWWLERRTALNILASIRGRPARSS